MSDTTQPDSDPTLNDVEVTTPSSDDTSIEQIARNHPSAGQSEPEGVEQEGNTEGEERAADGGSGAGVDYAGSGF